MKLRKIVIVDVASDYLLMPVLVENYLWFEADQMDSVSSLAHFGMQDAHFCNDLEKQSARC